MKNRKLVIGSIIIALVLLAVILGFFIGGNENISADPTDPFGSTAVTEPTDNNYGIETADPNEEFVIGTLPSDAKPIVISDTVTIYKVDKDPNEVIDRSNEFTSSHPEFLEEEEYGPFFMEEGSVCRNDKVITIDIYDPHRDTTFPISFGYITGKCNRFLYLNPTCSHDLADKIYVKFMQVDTWGGKGSLHYVSGDRTQLYDQNPSYYFFRAFDRSWLANYIDPKHPGAVWFAASPVEGPIYIDCIVYLAHGDMIATLRLTITKDESDGTYSLTNVENKNLIQDDADHSIIVQSDMELIRQMVKDTLNNPAQTGFISTQEYDPPMSDLIIDYRGYYDKLYYDYLWMDGETGDFKFVSTDHVLDVVPCLAVTVRFYYGHQSLTLYYQVAVPPYNGEPGYYGYVGRDHYSLFQIEVLRDQLGYPSDS